MVIGKEACRFLENLKLDDVVLSLRKPGRVYRIPLNRVRRLWCQVLLEFGACSWRQWIKATVIQMGVLQEENELFHGLTFCYLLQRWSRRVGAARTKPQISDTPNIQERAGDSSTIMMYSCCCVGLSAFQSSGV